jgi:hypothetical protein
MSFSSLVQKISFSLYLLISSFIYNDLAKEAKDKSYEDYNWDELCKQEWKLKDLEYIKSGKSDKMRVIINHHRTNGNAESYATEQYQTSAGMDE